LTKLPLVSGVGANTDQEVYQHATIPVALLVMLLQAQIRTRANYARLRMSLRPRVGVSRTSHTRQPKQNLTP